MQIITHKTRKSGFDYDMYTSVIGPFFYVLQIYDLKRVRYLNQKESDEQKKKGLARKNFLLLMRWVIYVSTLLIIMNSTTKV